MKVKLTRILIICAISISFYSCFNTGCINLFFEKDETYWTDTYRKGDTIIFVSNYNTELVKNYDTIFIVGKTNYKPKGNCNPVEVSNYDCESTIIDYTFKHDTISSKSDYLVQNVKENKGLAIPTLRVYGLEYNGQNLKDTTVILNTTKTKLNDCYTFHKKDCYDGWSNFKLKTFVWSRKMGLVMFVGENGDKFELLKKITDKK